MVANPRLVDNDNVVPLQRKSETAPITEQQIVTLADLEAWKLPPFQRPLTMNSKVMDFSEGLKTNGGFVSGVVTLGQLPGDPSLYKVDGNHRCEAAKLSGLTEFFIEVRIMQFDTMEEMAKEYERLNQPLVRMKPDDLLRAREQYCSEMRLLRQQCPYIGYDNVRRASTASPLVSMSAVLRCWFGSAGETPTMGGTGKAGAALADSLTGEEVANLSAFLNLAHSAWGNDPENYRLWANLNLTVTMWLFRQIVLKAPTGNKRYIKLTLAQFRLGLLAMCADGNYCDWLYGRNMTDRDRSPCYTKLRTIFSKRLAQEFNGKLPKLPQPSWYNKK